MSAGFAVIVLFVMGAGCNDGGRRADVSRAPSTIATTPERAPTPISTPDTSPTFTISGPVAEQVALTDENINAGARFVVDAERGRVFVIRPLPGVDPALDVFWLDNETLAVITPHGPFRVNLDGAVTPSSGIAVVETPTENPLTGVQSADGASSYRLASNEQVGVLLVGPAGAPPSFRVTNAFDAKWAPVGNVLAFSGNACAGFDLFTLEAGSGRYRNLTGSADGPALEYVWKPDAYAIAVFVLPDNNSRAIDLIDVRTGDRSRLVTMTGAGELRALSWNPGGSRLLFRAMRTGRGLCETGEPRPTIVERVTP